MATDQATRLREAVMEASNDHVAAHLTADNAGFDSIEDSFLAVGAALDTLIQYHRAAGAVEALNEICVKVDSEQYGRIRMPDVVQWVKVLAAAQARLAAYEEER